MNNDEENYTFPKNSFKPLYAEIKHRLCNPIGQVSFWVAFWVGLVGLGGMGIWVEWYRASPAGASLENLRTALHTFYPAIAFTACLQLILGEKDKKYVQSAAAGAAVLILLVSAFLTASDAKISQLWSIGVGVVVSVIAVLLWWIANGLEPIFQDGIPADAATGGDPLAGLAGDVKDFKQ